MLKKKERNGITVREDGIKFIRNGLSRKIYWDGNMISILKRHFPTTMTDELVEILGVSRRTIIRKARELGLQKDPEWLLQIWEERRMMAWNAVKRKGNQGCWKKGVRYNPDGEFKPGHMEDDETKARRIEGYRRWCMLHPKELKARGAKVWATRRRNEQQRNTNING